MQERVKSAALKLRDEIAKIINQENYFDDILVTVTDLEISKDLKNAKIFLSCMPDNKMNLVVKTLKKNKFNLVKVLKVKIKMKYIPKIKFYPDEGYKNFLEVEKIISRNE